MTKDTIIPSLTWRYATKKFDATKKLPKDTVNTLLNACNLTATSLGLQAYKMVVVEDQAIRNSIQKIAFNQPNVGTCSHLLILCAQNSVNDKDIEDFVHYMEQQRSLEKAALKGYEEMCKSFVNGLNKHQQVDWLNRQLYIVLGNLLTVCASLGIDSCPMEGFDPVQLDELLNLKKHDIHSVLMIPLGYRAKDDTYAQVKKVRKPLDEMVIAINELP